LWRRIAFTLGRGLVVMPANTNAGSVMVAAQRGARWGCELLLRQFLVIPLLFTMQDLTVRLGTGTGCGFGELILRRCGRGWALLAIITLVIVASALSSACFSSERRSSGSTPASSALSDDCVMPIDRSCPCSADPQTR
jgi:Mn2+/Fe2+ NRAMP family transporter